MIVFIVSKYEMIIQEEQRYINKKKRKIRI
jgi:hypothetical protein